MLLLVLAALTWAYQTHVLGGLVESPVDWGLSLVAAAFSTLALGSILEAIQKRGIAAALRRADRGEPPRDGDFAAAVGQLSPIGEPVLSPLGGVPCVAYEYEMRSGDVGVPAYSGHGLIPSVIRGPRGDTKLCGYPDLDEIGFRKLSGEEVRERAARYVRDTRFQELKVRDVFSVLRELYQDDDGSLRLDYRSADEPPDVSQLSFKEKVLPVGEEVRVLGLWSQRSGGLVNGWSRNVLLKLYPKGSKAIPTKSLPRRLIAPLVVLAIVHAVLWFPFRLKERQRQDGIAQELCQAARTGDAAAVGRLLTPALANALCRDGGTPLFWSSSAEVTGLLLEAGADPRAETDEGETALHRAIAAYDTGRVRLLLEAGADPDLASRRTGMTPLWTVGNTNPELRALLLEAGAVDDRVTAASGTPVAADGPVLAAVREYLDALLAGNTGRVAALSTDDHRGYWSLGIPMNVRNELPASVASYEGYVTGQDPGSTATVTIRGPRSGGEGTATRTLQLVRWEDGWRIHRLAIDYAVGGGAP